MKEDRSRFIELSVDAGDAVAQFNLGICYEQGDGVAQV